MNLRSGILPLAVAVLTVPLLAQRPTVTAADYARAEKFLAANLQGLVVGGSVTPNWLPDDRFWYRNQTPNGAEIVVVDPAKRTRTAYPDCAAAAVDCTTEAPAGGRGGRGRGGLATYPWIDLSRAGIWGHPGGGFATTTAMFRFPDFFRAGIAESGNHDQRENEDDWGERYQGLVVKNPDGTDSYDAGRTRTSRRT